MLFALSNILASFYGYIQKILIEKLDIYGCNVFGEDFNLN